MRVLLATDGSDCAIGAAKVLRELNFRSDLELDVLMVTYIPETFSAGRIQPWYPEWQQHEDKRVAEHQAFIAELFAARCASPKFSHRTGSVAHEILEEAKAFEADLIVMGARGHSTIGRIFLGSVSDNVATHAECSVLVVRPSSDDARESHLPTRLTVAYDGSNASTDAIVDVEQANWPQETHVSVLTVAPYYDYLLGDGMSAVVLENEQEVFAEMHRSAEKVSKKIAASLPNATAETVRGHHIGDTIVGHAEKSGSDLIVVGDTGHNALEQWLIGSTTKYVLRHAPCSVWISRHHRKAVDPERSTETRWAV